MQAFEKHEIDHIQEVVLRRRSRRSRVQNFGKSAQVRLHESRRRKDFWRANGYMIHGEICGPIMILISVIDNITRIRSIGTYLYSV